MCVCDVAASAVASLGFHMRSPDSRNVHPRYTASARSHVALLPSEPTPASVERAAGERCRQRRPPRVLLKFPKRPLPAHGRNRRRPGGTPRGRSQPRGPSTREGGANAYEEATSAGCLGDGDRRDAGLLGASLRMRDIDLADDGDATDCRLRHCDGRHNSQHQRCGKRWASVRRPKDAARVVSRMTPMTALGLAGEAGSPTLPRPQNPVVERTHPLTARAGARTSSESCLKPVCIGISCPAIPIPRAGQGVANSSWLPTLRGHCAQVLPRTHARIRTRTHSYMHPTTLEGAIVRVFPPREYRGSDST